MALEEAFVDIRANTAPFDRDLRDLNRRLERMDSSLEVSADTRQAERELDDFTDEDREIVVDVDADTARAARQVERLQDARTIPLSVDVDEDQAEQQLDALSDDREIVVDVDADTTRARRQIERLHDERGITVPVEIDEDGIRRSSGALGSLQQTLRRLAQTAGPLLSTAGNLGGSLTGLATSSYAGAAGVASLVATIINLGGQLSKLLGFAAALPAVLATGGAAMGALQLATMGVSDAFSAAMGSQEEFEEAIANLSPNAQEAAREVRALKDEFTDLRNTVQDAFFAEIEGEVTALARALGGPLEEGLTGIATQWGRAADSVAEYVRSTAGVENIERILQGAEDIVAGIADGLDALTTGFFDLAGAISEEFGGKAGQSIEDLMTDFGEWMSQIAESGQAVAWVHDAIDTFRQLWAVIVTVGRIIDDVFAAGQGGSATGESGPLADLQSFLSGVESFTSSGAGSSIIGTFTSMFDIVGKLAGAMDLLRSAYDATASAIETVKGWLDQLGPQLSATWTQIVAWATGVGEWFSNLFTRIGEIVSTGALNVGQWFGQLFAQIDTAVSGAYTSVTAWFSRMWTRLQEIAAGIYESVVGWFSRMWSWLRTTASSGVSSIVSFFTGLPGRVMAAVSGLWGQLRAWFGGIISRARVQAANIVSAIIAPFRNLWSGIRSALSNINITGYLRNLVPANLRRFLPFANGGIVYGPTPALIGEAGAEAVVPLTRPRRALQIARQSGLDRLIIADYNRRTHTLPSARTSPTREQPAVQNFYVQSNAQDSDLVARKTAALVARAIGV